MLFPFFAARLSIVKLPKRRKDVFVIKQRPNLLRKALPDGIVDPVTRVELYKCREEFSKGLPLVTQSLIDIACVERVAQT